MLTLGEVWEGEAGEVEVWVRDRKGGEGCWERAACSERGQVSSRKKVPAVWKRGIRGLILANGSRDASHKGWRGLVGYY